MTRPAERALQEHAQSQNTLDASDTTPWFGVSHGRPSSFSFSAAIEQGEIAQRESTPERAVRPGL
jgi:hypothetical protein